MITFIWQTREKIFQEESVFIKGHIPESFEGSDNPTEIVWLHTFDYDICLKNKEAHHESKLGFDTAVFIDAPSPRFSHDALIPGISSPLTEEKYYPSLCKFFDRLEKELNVKVEIAAHPASDHEMYPKYFGERKTVQGQTFEMIKLPPLQNTLEDSLVK